MTGRKISHLQVLEELQVPLGERGSLILEEEEDQTQETMKQDMKMRDMMIEARVEIEGGTMEQPESITRGVR